MAKAKTLQPAPIYTATLEGGNIIRLSFQQPIGKPFDASRAKRLAELMLAGEEFRKLPCPEFDAARADLEVAENVLKDARGHRRDAEQDRDNFHGDLRAEIEVKIRDAQSREDAAEETVNAAQAALVLAFDNRTAAEMEFKRNWRAPIVKAEISHHTIGTIDADAIQAPIKKAKKPDIAAAVREIIKDAIDAESALARIAAIVNA